VLRGQATITVAGEECRVGAGSAVYVPAGVDHRFHSISDDLDVLVVVAPAESDPGPPTLHGGWRRRGGFRAPVRADPDCQLDILIVDLRRSGYSGM